LLHEPRERERLVREATESVHQRARSELSVARYYDAFDVARSHLEHSTKAEPTDALREMRSLARWTGLHLTLAGVGLLRAPGIVNRAGARQPNWDGTKLKPILGDGGLGVRPGA
jgi:hypothetical protein